MFAELDATSNFTFLTGGSHPEELVERAAVLGLGAIAIADENSVAGIVRAHAQIRELARRIADPEAPRIGWIAPETPYERYPGLADGTRSGGYPSKEERQPPFVAPPSAPVAAVPRLVPRLVPAARLVTRDGLTVTALPRDRAAWGRLCRLLTLGRTRAEKGSCDIGLDDILAWGEGHELLLHPPCRDLPRSDSPVRGARRRGRDPSPPPPTLAGRRGRVAAAGAPADAPLPRSGLAAPRPALRRRGCRPFRPPGRPRRASRHPHRRRRLAADAPRRPPPPDRRARRHPPQGPRRRPRPRRARQRRAPAALRGRDARAPRPPCRRRRPRVGGRRPLHLLARRAALRVPRRDRRGREPGRPAAPPRPRRARLALPLGRAGARSAPCSSTSSR